MLTNDGMNKRISSPMSNSSNRGQSKSNSSSNNSSMERLQRNGSDRTIGTMKTSSSYDNMRMTADNANSAFDKSDIDGLRINSSENGSSKVNFR